MGGKYSEKQRILDWNENEVENENTTILIDQELKYSYPKRVFFIICTEFCERFNFHGMQAILYVYLTDKLNLDKRSANVQVSILTMIVYFTCIIGGVLSDSWLGKFKTILTLSMVYVIGSVMVAIGAVGHMHDSSKIIFYIGQLLIALGSGGIKPCVAAFGGDQFKLPEQSEYMDGFFSIFFFVVSAGALLSTALTPVLKENVQCFDQNDCYPLAFGIPAVLMIAAIVVFIIGRPSYTMVPPSGNILIKVVKCTWNALVIKWSQRSQSNRGHFLDYSNEKYGYQLVNETKCLLNMLVLLIPLPFFWMLLDDFIFYEVLMLIDILIFMILAQRYKPNIF